MGNGVNSICSRGAHCQLCTATFQQLHDVELILDSYPINRSITAAKELFRRRRIISLCSNDRFGLTHQPISDIDIICSSLLHSISASLDGS